MSFTGRDWEPDGDVRHGTFTVTLDEHFLNNAEVLSRKMSGGSARRVPSPRRDTGEWNKAKDVLSLPAATVVVSGGRAEILPELHACWRLDIPAAEAWHETVCRIGRALAIRFGGDPLFQQTAQVVRQSAQAVRASVAPVTGDTPA